VVRRDRVSHQRRIPGAQQRRLVGRPIRADDGRESEWVALVVHRGLQAGQSNASILPLRSSTSKTPVGVMNLRLMGVISMLQLTVGIFLLQGNHDGAKAT
jgi:hypothetical protein